MRVFPATALAVALGASLLVGTASAQASERATPEPTAAKLFVQDAKEATAERKRGKRWKVTLTGVNPTTLWFVDRPGRDAGRQTTASFVRDWAGYGFATVPPNAVIEHEGSEGVAVELKNPRYDRKAGTLTYTALLDPGSGKRLDRRMNNVSLFIDDAGYTMTSASFQVSNMSPGQRLTIEMSEPGGEPDPNYAAFYVTGQGTSTPFAAPLIDTESGPISLVSLDIGPTVIELLTSAESAGGGCCFSMNLFIMTPPTVTNFAVTLQADPGVEVALALQGQQPQVINETPTIFFLTPS